MSKAKTAAQMRKYVYDTVYEGRFKQTARARTQDDSALRDGLKGRLSDAMREIELAITCAAYAKNYPSEACFVDKIPSTGEYTEPQAYISDLLAIYKSWGQSIARYHESVARDIIVFGMTYAQVSDQRRDTDQWTHRLTRQRVAKIFKEALNAWCMLRGWGDQINPPEPDYKPKPKRVRPPPILKPTKIIEFQDEPCDKPPQQRTN